MPHLKDPLMHDLAATLALLQQHSSLTSVLSRGGARTDAHVHSLWCRLREAREAAALSYPELADWLALHSSRIAHVECCKQVADEERVLFRPAARATPAPPRRR